MNIDNQLYHFPLIGRLIERLYNYFRQHIALTDFFHVMVGLGIGLIIGGNSFLWVGIVALTAGILYHGYAFIKG